MKLVSPVIFVKTRINIHTKKAGMKYFIPTKEQQVPRKVAPPLN